MATEKTSMLDLAVDKNFKTEKKKSGYGNGQNQGNDNPTTVNGYDKSEVVSALQKAIRRGMEPEALYWATELMASGEAYRMWRRLVVIAAEDVGLADPELCARIMTMKQAHDFGREWNIVFLAVMILCRAPKNREADDASYMYELRRKEGWKITMPPEAVDGHTRRGRTNLYRLADRTGKNWADLWNEEFYYDASLLKNYQEIETDGVAERYRRGLMDFLGIPFDTYDLETCKQPRLLTGGAARQASADSVASRIPEKPEIRNVGNADGEIVKNVYLVRSFTAPKDQDVWYEVDVEEPSCTCPAYANQNGAVCKHIMAALREVEVE